MCEACAERGATIARLRGALELFKDYTCNCAIINEGRGPKCSSCVARAALATPDTGRRWLEAVEQAKGALREAREVVRDSWSLTGNNMMVHNEGHHTDLLARIDAALEALR